MTGAAIGTVPQITGPEMGTCLDLTKQMLLGSPSHS